MRQEKSEQTKADETVRLDKWLWAARFYKTRSLCKHAIEGGKVHYLSGQDKTLNVKPNKMVRIGDRLQISQSAIKKIVIVDALSDKRGKAEQAQLLYHETDESVSKREHEVLQRKSARDSVVFDDKKPSKRDRRRLFKFNETNNN